MRRGTRALRRVTPLLLLGARQHKSAADSSAYLRGAASILRGKQREQQPRTWLEMRSLAHVALPRAVADERLDREGQACLARPAEYVDPSRTHGRIGVGRRR